MLRVGLTGGIGSGKSTIAGIFVVLGIPVSNADQEAKRVMNTDPDLRQQIIRHFGPEAYNDKGLNRSWLASQVFTDQHRDKLELLNSLVHPVTIREGEKWMKEQSLKSHYAIREAALIFESKSGGYLDYVIGVSAPAVLRIERTMNRDKITREEVLQRMKNQMDEEEKLKLCDFLIYNDGQQAVLPQVLALHERLLALSSATL
ncbi:dephospho-CoA kinase [Flavitalea flava]